MYTNIQAKIPNININRVPPFATVTDYFLKPSAH